MRIERLEAQVAMLAGEVLGIALDVPLCLVAIRIHLGDVHHPPAKIERLLNRLGDARSCSGLDDVPIDHHLDRVLAAVVDGRRLIDGIALAIDAQPRVTSAANFLPQGFVLLLPLSFQRSHDVKLCPLFERQHLVDDLVGGLRSHRATAVGAMAFAQSRVEDSEIIVDLGDSADRRARAFARCLLLNTDGRRETGDLFDLRFLDLTQELSRVATQTLDITPAGPPRRSCRVPVMIFPNPMDRRTPTSARAEGAHKRS